MIRNPEINIHAEKREEEIDQEIEVLKESHPFITKEEYWSALKRAQVSYDKLLTIFMPLQEKVGSDNEPAEEGKIPLNDEARPALEDLLLNCQEKYLPCFKDLTESMDDSFYFLLPTTRPAFTEETNPIFGAEKYGIPKILPTALVVPEKEIWFKLFPSTKYFNETEEGFCTDFNGFNVDRKVFPQNNIFSHLSLNIIYGRRQKKSDMWQSVEHENIHAVDFLLDKRKGIGQLITEFIAHRIEGKISKPKMSKSGENPFDLFLKNAYIYALKLHLSPGEAGRAIGRLEKAASRADDILSFSATTQLLLNCETVDEFVDSVKEKIKEANEQK